MAEVEGFARYSTLSREYAGSIFFSLIYLRMVGKLPYYLNFNMWITYIKMKMSLSLADISVCT